MPAQHDVNEVIQKFLQGRCPERPGLFRAIQAEIRASRAAMHMLAEVGSECEKNSLGPIEGLSLAMIYGIVLGIIMERERTDRRIIH